MAHYVTNEMLAATLVAGEIYLTLRLLRTKEPSLSHYIWIGLCLGAAMLTKATAVLMLPIVVAALAINLARQHSPFALWLRNLGAMLVICLAICGWHYLRVGLRSDSPFLGMAGAFAWWQDPGYHTSADYFRFGSSLIRPLFSGFSG